VLPRSWAGPDDEPGGPNDIVRLLQVRPCYLLGRVATSYLYDYGLHLMTHGEPPPAEDPDEDADE
jgi:hypothetical protein